ncbi:MAG: hypothetical protein ABS75_21310 [Pelagibacterium sp. SCN 63-23]|nr:MAG: hypothetical protein ABS75_21310 [Pelagibacterium sp. SCN 63-23]
MDAEDNTEQDETETAELFYMMHELSRLIGVYFDQAMAKHRLTRAQWWGMMHIREHEGATQTELASIMQMGRASAGKLLERLEANGWIVRRPDEHDNRVRRVYVKDAAPEVTSAMSAAGHELFKDFLRDITPEEERAMLLAMRKMKTNAEHYLGLKG